ncbi:MAG: AEC family transporter [Clostridia bacterium]|nr:AEC family transporter [Clostridia bacterium]
MAALKAISILSLFVAIGFATTKTGYVKKETGSYLAHIVTKLVMPIWIMSTLLSDNVTVEKILNRKSLFFTGVLTCLILLLIGLFVAKIFKIHDRRKYVLLPLLFTTNSIFVGMPVCKLLFGESGVLSCTILGFGTEIVIWTIGIFLVTRGANKLRPAEEKIKFPLPAVTIVYVLCFILKFCGISLPAVLEPSFAALGNSVSYLAMLFLGMSLATIKFGSVFKDQMSYIYLFGRCLILPIIVNIVLRLTGFMPIEYIDVATVVFSVSPGIAMTMFYREYDLDYVFGSSMTFSCVLLNIATVPFVLFITELLPL